jgi:hypothetical protein
MSVPNLPALFLVSFGVPLSGFFKKKRIKTEMVEEMADRDKKHLLANLLKKLETNKAQDLHNYLRMNNELFQNLLTSIRPRIELFQNLLALIRLRIEKRNTFMRDAVAVAAPRCPVLYLGRDTAV